MYYSISDASLSSLSPTSVRLGTGGIDGCNEFLIQTLYNHGIRSAQQLSTLDREFLAQFPTVTEENVERVLTYYFMGW